MSESLQKALYVKLQELIAIQSEGEWDDLLIQKDARKFAAELMPLFAALEAERDALRKDAARYRWLLQQAWFQVAFDRFDFDDGGMQNRFEECAAQIIDAAIAAKEPK